MPQIGMWKVEKVRQCILPPKAASAFATVTGGLKGAEYEPVLYVGSKEDDGTDYCIIAVQTLITASSPKRFVRMVIKDGQDGQVTLVSVRGLSI